MAIANKLTTVKPSNEEVRKSRELLLEEFDKYLASHSTSDSTPKLDIKPELIKIMKKSYLQSEQWQNLREACMKRSNYTCEACGIDGVPLEVHHLHYRTFTKESTSDLVCVCRHCHQAIHDKYGYDYTSEFPVIKP